MAETKVNDIKPLADKNGHSGYSLCVKSSTNPFRPKKKLTTRGVILSGGVLGTVPLLLKLKKTSLPLLSDRLGYDIRTNNETLISVSTLRRDYDMSRGVAIGSLLHTDENSHLEIVRYSKGSDFWKLLHLPFTRGRIALLRITGIFASLFRSPWGYFKVYFLNSWSKRTAILLFMQTLDSTLRFRRNRMGKMVSSVSTGNKPSPDIPESFILTKKYGKLISGKATSFALEAVAGIPSTAHILGGAVMGKDVKSGVINQNNEVFGYANMLIADGSMISANPGVNPALSIMAITERAMERIPARQDPGFNS